MNVVVEREMVPSKISILPTNPPANLLTNLHTIMPPSSPRKEVLETSVVQTTVRIEGQTSKGEQEKKMKIRSVPRELCACNGPAKKCMHTIEKLRILQTTEILRTL